MGKRQGMGFEHIVFKIFLYGRGIKKYLTKSQIFKKYNSRRFLEGIWLFLFLTVCYNLIYGGVMKKIKYIKFSGVRGNTVVVGFTYNCEKAKKDLEKQEFKNIKFYNEKRKNGEQV